MDCLTTEPMISYENCRAKIPKYLHTENQFNKCMNAPIDASWCYVMARYLRALITHKRCMKYLLTCDQALLFFPDRKLSSSGSKSLNALSEEFLSGLE